MSILRKDKPRALETQEKTPVEREATRPELMFRPDVDIVERETGFVVTADLPGVDEKHVNVSLEKGVLTLEGRLAAPPPPGWTLVHAEYRPGGYRREFALSERIDPAGIRASMRDGVLELQLPKAEVHRPRNIEVRAG
ncbi:MAG: Hsp20/alpha crystallin family protein [Myxococcota bacterium]